LTTVRQVLNRILSNDYDYAKELIDNGEDVNQIHNTLPVLSIACMKLNIEIAKYLIENGADVNMTDNTNDTPLALTTMLVSHKYQYEEIIDILVSNGADPDAVDEMVDIHLESYLMSSSDYY